MIHWKAWLALGLVYFLPYWLVFQSHEQARQPVKVELDKYPWIYLRDNRPLDPGEKVVEGIFTGDIICGREGKSLAYKLDAVVSWLKAADFVMGNLECVVSSHAADRGLGSFDGGTPGPIYLFAPPKPIELLREAGFDILGVANNHIFDLGEAGLSETIQNLRTYGIQAAGLCTGRACRDGVVIEKVGGLRIAIVAVNTIPIPFSKVNLTEINWETPQVLLSMIQSLKPEVHAIVVSIHWGKEYELDASPAQKRIAKQLISAGVDLVVGHHPHVVQGVNLFSAHERLEEGFVTYSLGNFIADQQFGDTVGSLVLRAYFDEQGLRAVQALPLWAGLKPALLELSQTDLLLQKIMPEAKPVAFHCDQSTCHDYDENLDRIPSITGLFWFGEVDLTGDGISEKVQRQAERVVVFANGIESWKTPVEWKVVDLALGDPDNDGRQEMLLAFWRADAAGIERSHPFIVGYRGGSYHETWGGSGVSDPILEVELSDVDSDGMEELVVLEQRSSQKEAVTVWDWHGWGFSLKWRSQEGEYKNLRVVQNPATGEAIIVLDEQP